MNETIDPMDKLEAQINDRLSKGLCPSCGKKEKAEPHPCPYRQEICDDSETMCECCEECIQVCADGV
jgi:hypothetical protein